MDGQSNDLYEDTVSDETETSTVEFNIIVSASDWPLEVLASKFGDSEDSEIIIPDYQRKFVWDMRRASALIESFVIGLPVPQVFFYENSKGQLEVIDGQQRITAIAYFFEGYFGKPDHKGNRKVFSLKGLEQRKDLEGITFEKMDDRTKRKIKNSNLRGVTVKQLTPDQEQPESVYHIFERLNTGGQPLNDQEIRNAVYRGALLTQFERLNLDPNWRLIIGKPDPDPKQRDIELILRLLSLYRNVGDYSPPMKDFLSREMAKNRYFDTERAITFSHLFARATAKVVAKIERPFRPRGILNAATMEAVLVAVLENIDNDQLSQEAYNRLIADKRFDAAISSNTSSVENVSQRRALAQEFLL